MEGWKIEVDGWQTWVWDFVLMSVLVIQWVEVKLGPAVEHKKIDQILRNQEKQSKVIKIYYSTTSRKWPNKK
jgi:hypothetical protein